MFNDRYGLTQAVIKGRKTMTRRIMNNQYGNLAGCVGFTKNGRARTYVRADFDNGISEDATYAVDEVVAVAQSYNSFYDDTYNPVLFPAGAGWGNKMFVKAELMPHQIRITGIKYERLQDISEEDCMREGIIYRESQNPIECGYTFHGSKHSYGSPRAAFASLIDKVSGRGTWKRNPWVVVYEFELVK